MQRDINYENEVERQELYNEEEQYTDSFLEKVSQKFKNRRVPANKKQPIYCDNVEIGFIEFAEEDFVCVLDLKEVSQDEKNESE